MKKLKNPVSLGSFAKVDAKFVAGTLGMHAGIAANVVNVTVGDNEPTDWWAVEVAKKDEKLASIFIKGWRIGKVTATVERDPGAMVLWPEYAAFFAPSS